MNREECKQFFRRAWENKYEHSQKDRFAKTGEGTYNIRNCIESIFIDCTPETKFC